MTHFALQRKKQYTLVPMNTIRSTVSFSASLWRRSDDLQAKLDAAPDWDLIVCDEAHRIAASYFGGEIKETQRYKLGKLLDT